MKTATITPKKAQKERQAWLASVEKLADQVESWAKDRHWFVHRELKEIVETPLGAYTVPVVRILAAAGQVQLDPIARYAGRSEGRVDLFAWPSLSRMLLIRAGNTWKLKTDSGLDWPQDWNQQTFEHLVKVLNAAN